MLPKDRHYLLMSADLWTWQGFLDISRLGGSSVLPCHKKSCETSVVIVSVIAGQLLLVATCISF